MKLKMIQKDPGTRLAVTVRSSTYEMLEAYLAYYKQVYGQEPVPGEVVDTILRTFMDDDRDFQKALKSQ